MSDLIYDVGMHRGEDTAHYLGEGFRVVAVEANPALCDLARERFAEELGDGRLVIIEAAIHESPGTIAFWICDAKSEWSSFDRAVATRDGSAAHPIEIECTPFDSIVREFGRAHYIKIDIEGQDQACLDQLPAELSPDYISVELNHGGVERQLERLHDLGYNGFKLICQSLGWAPVTERTLGLFSRSGRSLPMRAVQLLGNLPQRLKPLIGRWGFPCGSSGPIGSRTAGDWISFHQASRLVERLVAPQRLRPEVDLGWWFDIHATRVARAHEHDGITG